MESELLINILEKKSVVSNRQRTALYPQSAHTVCTSAATIDVSRLDRTINKHRRENDTDFGQISGRRVLADGLQAS